MTNSRTALARWVALLVLLVSCSGGPRTQIPTTEVAPLVEPSLASRAVRSALDDSRTSAFFRDHAPTSATVDHSATFNNGELLVDVIVAPTTDFPTEGACDVGGHDGVVTGVRWLISPDGRDRLAVSPIWGSVSCLS